VHQKQIFLGKLAGELWASEKNDLRAAIARGILGRAGAIGFLGRWAMKKLTVASAAGMPSSPSGVELATLT